VGAEAYVQHGDGSLVVGEDPVNEWHAIEAGST
jgi:hypothetical protein